METDHTDSGEGRKPLSNAERQRRYRERHKAQTITIRLTADELATLNECFERQRYDAERGQFAKAALLVGARFRANQGNTDRR